MTEDEMKEADIRNSLKPAFDREQARDAPGFDALWAKAELAYGKQRKTRLFSAVAAVLAMAVIAATLWPSQQAELHDDYLIADALMNSTLWSAPSDSLMPEHQFDIYQEIPFLIESTNSLEGTLL
jgi:hypothetical protein